MLLEVVPPREEDTVNLGLTPAFHPVQSSEPVRLEVDVEVVGIFKMQRDSIRAGACGDHQTHWAEVVPASERGRGRDENSIGEAALHSETHGNVITRYTNAFNFALPSPVDSTRAAGMLRTRGQRAQ